MGREGVGIELNVRDADRERMLELVGDTIRSWCWRTVGVIQIAEFLRHGEGGKVGTELFGQVGIG